MTAALLLGMTATPLVAATAEEQYTAALARERALLGSTASDDVSELRALMVAYEEIVRLHPLSGYSDNALWQAAGLALVAFERHRDAHDLGLGRELLQRLEREYPSSSLVARVPGRLQEFVRLLEPVELRRITRAQDGDVVTVTIELGAEVEYLAERLDGPPRLYFDFSRTFTVPPLRNATLDYPDGEPVRQIRLGRYPGQTTRVVLDIAAVESYSFYTLDEPFRLVVEAVPDLGWSSQPHPAEARPAVSAEPAASPVSLEVLAATRPEEVHRLELLPVPEDWSARRLAPLPPAGTVDAADPGLASTGAQRPAMHDVLYPTLGAGVTPSDPVPAPHARTIAFAPLRGRPVITAPPLPARSLAQVDPVSARGVTPATALAETPDASPAVVPAANAAGTLSLGRQLGLGVSRVVIDAGHGGYDPGARAAELTESALVLDVALRLEQRLAAAGIEVVQTRRDDSFVPLRARTELANRVGADLLLSIHANAARDADARGIETYYLDLATDPMAQRVAARENASATERMSDLPTLVSSIATNNKIVESRDLAELVQRHLVDGVRELHPAAQDLGVKRAPFVVLIGATMPSVLAEISFLTNAEEAAFLATDAYRDRIAEALFRSVVDYQTTLKPLGIAADDDN